MKCRTIGFLILMVVSLSVQSAIAVELQLLVVGHGYVQGEDFACADNCTKTYEKGTVVHLKALPFPDSCFAGWKIDGVPHEGVITLEEDTVLSAVFERTEDPMLADGVTLYWYDGNGGRDYATIALNEVFISLENREQWNVSTEEEYDEAIRKITQAFHPQSEIMSQNRYQMSLKTSAPLEKEQWFRALFRLQQLTYVQWAGPILYRNLEEPGSRMMVWDGLSVYFPESYSEEHIKSIEQEYGLVRIEQLIKPNSFTYQVEEPLITIETANRLHESGLVELSTPAISTVVSPGNEFPDGTFLGERWHLNNTCAYAGKDTVWKQSKGSRIVITTVDKEGIEL